GDGLVARADQGQFDTILRVDDTNGAIGKANCKASAIGTESQGVDMPAVEDTSGLPGGRVHNPDRFSWACHGQPLPICAEGGWPGDASGSSLALLAVVCPDPSFSRNKEPAVWAQVEPRRGHGVLGGQPASRQLPDVQPELCRGDPGWGPGGYVTLD